MVNEHQQILASKSKTAWLAISIRFSITQLPNYPILKFFDYSFTKSSSAFAGVPGVDAAGPEEEALLVIANLLDDFGFIRQMHGANSFLDERRTGGHKRGRRILHEISLAGVGIAPTSCTIAVNDGQDFLTLADFGRLLPGRNHHGFAGRRDESLVCILDDPGGKFTVYVIQFARGRAGWNGNVFRLVAVEVASDERHAAAISLGDQIVAKNAVERGFYFGLGGRRQFGQRRGRRFRL